MVWPALLAILLLNVVAGTPAYADKKVELTNKGEFVKKTELEKKEEMERLKNREDYELNLMGYDETSLYVTLQRLGGKEVTTVIRNNVVYLPVTDIFDFLKIKNTMSAGLDSITGFFIEPAAVYTIDKANNEIRYRSKIWHLAPDDIVRTSTTLYLRLDLYNDVFGLECIFDSYNLSVKLNTLTEVPAIIEMRQQEMRSNINKLNGTVKADTTIGRSYPLFHFGTADWAVVSQQMGGTADTRFNLSLGSVVAGGEANVGLNYYTNTTVSEKNQYYLWRYANNDNHILRQVMMGKIAIQSVSSIYAPVVGIQFTNRPTTFRRSFGTYNITDITGPNWIVELYVNNVLVDYTTADASGFFSLNVPLVYGSSDIKLRFYGPYGEVQTKERHIEVPVTFLPSREFEYTVNSGLVEDDRNSIFSRASINYGLTKGITVGGGMEYLSSVTSGSYMPFVNTSVKLLPNLFFSGDYTHGVRGKALLNYRLPSNLQFELDYINYTKGQTAIIYNYLEERKASVSAPFRLKGFSGLSRLSVDQIILPGKMKEVLADWLISAGFSRVSVNLTTYLSSMAQSEVTSHNSNLYGNLAVSVRLSKGLMVTPQAQYDYIKNRIISLRCGIEEMVFNKGFLGITFEQNYTSNLTIANLGFRYDLSFARVSGSASQVNNTTRITESANGSLLYDKKSNYLSGSNRVSVGRSGITILPFLDVNDNGRYDKGEPKVQGVKVQIKGGLISYSDRDTTIHVSDLEPYASYFVEINSDAIENVSWQIKNKTFRVTPDPNNFRIIEVPVTIAGEVSGTVKVITRDAKPGKGLGQIRVCIYNRDSVLVGSTITESDGFFSYLGLRPGSYNVCVDTSQLRKINYRSLQGCLPITVNSKLEGDVIDGLSFTLVPDSNDTIGNERHSFFNETKMHNDDEISVAEPPQPKKVAYGILVDVVADRITAEKLKARLDHKFRLPVMINQVGHDYEVILGRFGDYKEAEQLAAQITSSGYTHRLIVDIK